MMRLRVILSRMRFPSAFARGLTAREGVNAAHEAIVLAMKAGAENAGLVRRASRKAPGSGSGGEGWI
jgi:K+-sensing histidine kinase KdpD